MGDDSSVLVTGGRGFVGRAASELLRRNGHSVLCLDRNSDGGAVAQKGAADREVVCDITEAVQLQQVFERERIGAIIHLAALLPTAAQRNPVEATRVNVVGSLNLLEMTRRFGIRRFVFGSSLSIYGTCPLDDCVAEIYHAAPEDIYGAAKLYVEQLGQAYRVELGLEFLSLRIGRVVGPGARSSSSAWRSQIFEALQTGEAAEISLPYLGSERILLVHVEDVAKMLVALLEAPHPAHGVYNALCESVVVSELKRELETFHPKLRIELGKDPVVGNPRRVDAGRFQHEFAFRTVPIFEQLRQAAGKGIAAKNARAVRRSGQR